MSEPTTEAGRRLRRGLVLEGWVGPINADESIDAAIAAIEAEARAQALADVRRRVEGLPTWDKRTVPGGFHVNRAAVLAAIEEAARDR